MNKDLTERLRYLKSTLDQRSVQQSKGKSVSRKRYVPQWCATTVIYIKMCRERLSQD